MKCECGNDTERIGTTKNGYTVWLCSQCELTHYMPMHIERLIAAAEDVCKAFSFLKRFFPPEKRAALDKLEAVLRQREQTDE